MTDPRARAVAAAGAVFLVALGLRVFLITLPGPTYDLESWRGVISALRQGHGLYGATHYNYSPLWALVLVGVDALSGILRVPFPLLIRLVLLGVDAGIMVLVRELALRRGRSSSEASLVAVLFFANPVSVIASSYLYTFDNVSIAFLMLALLAMAHPEPRKGPAAAWLSLSLLAKHVTWFHPLLFARRDRDGKRSWPVALAPYAVFALSFVPFLGQWPGIREQVIRYRGLGEAYGTEPLRFISWLPSETTTILFGVAGLAAIFLLSRIEVDRACLLLFLVVLIFTPGICAYYFAWPIALGALFPSVGFFVYTLVVTGFFLKSPDVLGLDWPHLPGWWGCFWATVFWLLWEIRSRARASGSGLRAPRTAAGRRDQDAQEGGRL